MKENNLKWSSIKTSAPKISLNLGTSVELNDKMYIFGGLNEDNIELNTLWEYNVKTNLWTELKPFGILPSPRTNKFCSIQTINNKIVIFGYNFSKKRNDIWVYDPENNTWEEKIQDKKPKKRFFFSSTVNDNKMYIYGGKFLDFLNELWVYDLEKNSWTELKPNNEINKLPTKRYGQSMIVIKNKIIVFGGRFGNCLNDVWVYDLEKNSWELMKPSGNLPSKRFGHSAQLINGKMVIFGGFSDDTVYKKDCFLNDVWVYDLDTNSWEQKDSGSTPRDCHTTVSLNNKMYVFGGDNGSSFLNDLWLLS